MEMSFYIMPSKNSKEYKKLNSSQVQIGTVERKSVVKSVQTQHDTVLVWIAHDIYVLVSYLSKCLLTQQYASKQYFKLDISGDNTKQR